MFARSTTIVGNPSAIDAGIALVRDEILPALTQLDGFVGMSMMVERGTGRCIVTAAWQDDQALRNSAGAVVPLRARAVEILGGAPEVQEWEIAALHREHETHDEPRIRATWLRADPARVDEGTDTFRTVVLPQVEQVAGFCSASFMIDRKTGRAVSTICFENQASLEASRPIADQIRKSASQRAKADILEVAEFELAIAHLRVPELV